jgi:hypothetical protein
MPKWNTFWALVDLNMFTDVFEIKVPVKKFNYIICELYVKKLRFYVVEESCSHIFPNKFLCSIDVAQSVYPMPIGNYFLVITSYNCSFNVTTFGWCQHTILTFVPKR